MLIRRIARPLLSVAFIGQGVDALRNPKPAADAARPALDGMRALPDPIGPKVPSDAETFARVNAAVQVGGGLLLATGKMPRLASAALAFTVIPGSLGGHMFWTQSDPQRKADERRAFMTDLSLLGGLIIAAVDTEGKPSLGWRGRRAARKVSEAVTAALPVGAASGGALTDSAFAEKLGHGLNAARERGAELADVARDRAPEIAEAARERAATLAEIARERGPEIAEAARGRAAELADVARDRAPEIADAARGRAAGLAEVARDRAPELAEAARDRAEAARDRASDLAGTARTQTKQIKREAKKQKRRLN
ncbi:MAG TPA: DoxX family protein [Mycobacterium sp.]|nr:DoxX family protein [Mycobacterium sp.]